MVSKIVAIDGNSIMNRAFYGIMNSRLLVTTDGIYTNAIYGFLSILLKLINDERPEYICVAFDLKAPTFRHKQYEGYKATRKGMPDELRMQMPLIKDVLKAMNIKIFEIEGYEADDILGTIASYGEENNMEVLLLTGDRDYLQLASDKVTVRIPTTKQGNTETTDYTPEIIKEKFGIEPKQFIQIKGLMGDTSDNIPGVPGVGEKTAFSLITKYNNLDDIYAALEAGQELEGVKGKLKEKLETNKDLAFMSRDLGTIFREVPLAFSLEDIEFGKYNNDELYNLFVRLQFKNYIDKLNLQAPAESSEVKEELFDDSDIIIKDLKEFFVDVQNSISKKNNTDNEEKDCIEIAYFYDDYFTVFYNNITYSSKNLEIEDLKKIFENENLIKIGYDEKQDYLKLKRKGINPVNMSFDLTIASYVLNPAKDSYKLNDIILEELGIVVEDKKENEQISFLSLDNNADTKEREAKYSRYIYYCKEKLEAKLKQREEYKLFAEIEMPLLKVLAEMEYTGVLVDKEMLQVYSKELNKNVEELNDEIMELAGEEFNVNSPKQLGKILFEKLNLTVIKETKNGYSTDADVLERLKEEHPIVEKILEYRTLNKLKATYVDGLLPLINQETKRIHAKFNQTVTATGRISCTDPNLQNIPIRTDLGKQLRKVFVAPEGSKFIDADYSQIELRILSHISGDKNMIDAFNNEQDIHAITASQVFDVPLEEVTKQMRSEAKAVNFGIVYGISDFGLGANIGISRKKAKVYIEKYFEKYPGIKQFMTDTVESCKEKGYVETLWGRRRYVPEIKSNNFNVRQFGERVAMNAPIQGTAADVIKIAMINIQKSLEKNNMKSKLILQVHDELVIEAPDEELEKAKEILVNEMENVIKLSIPLKVEAEVGKDWYEAH
ncbi:MAG: DNA polymerase I [Clostridia bacterium]|nr:DNA polymerase I [Clostridia bacterium]